MRRSLSVVALASLGLGLACTGEPAPPSFAVSGTIVGTVSGGVKVSLVDASATTLAIAASDPVGRYGFLGIPPGSYTVVPSAPGTAFVPGQWDVTSDTVDLAGLDFRSTPPSAPFTVRVAGDVASGVASGSYPGANAPAPNADVVVYDPSSDAWTIRIRWDAPPQTRLGGALAFRGTPAVGSYTESTAGAVAPFGPCWTAASVAGGGADRTWTASAFTLSLSAVGAGVPTDVPGASAGSLVTDYPVHGAFHATCTPASGSSAQGTVAVDVAF